MEFVVVDNFFEGSAGRLRLISKIHAKRQAEKKANALKRAEDHYRSARANKSFGKKDLVGSTRAAAASHSNKAAKARKELALTRKGSVARTLAKGKWFKHMTHADKARKNAMSKGRGKGNLPESITLADVLESNRARRAKTKAMRDKVMKNWDTSSRGTPFGNYRRRARHMNDYERRSYKHDLANQNNYRSRAAAELDTAGRIRRNVTKFRPADGHDITMRIAKQHRNTAKSRGQKLP